MAKLSSVEIDKMVLSAYNRIAHSYTSAYAENDDMDARYLDEFVSMIEGKTILDMGCGTGTNTNYIIEKGFDVIGVDASKNMLDVAKKFYPNIDFKEQDILHTSFEAETFDGIVLSYVINHFNQDGLRQLECEICRVLKKDGLIFVSAHVGNSEEVVPDPLDATIQIYYNFLSIDMLDALFTGYKREYYSSRQSYGEEEFLCDKMFVIYRK